MIEVVYGDIRIEVDRSRICDGVLRATIIRYLRERQEHPDLETSYYLFAKLLSQSRKANGLPFALPTIPIASDALYSAYDAWMLLDEDLLEKWNTASEAAASSFSLATAPAPLPEGTSGE